jgi:hypothetical protein
VLVVVMTALGDFTPAAQYPVIASEAKQSRTTKKVWIVSSLAACLRHSGRREAAIRNLEIPGSMLRIAPE